MVKIICESNCTNCTYSSKGECTYFQSKPKDKVAQALLMSTKDGEKKSSEFCPDLIVSIRKLTGIK